MLRLWAARSRVNLRVLLVMVMVPLLGVSTASQTRRDGRRSVTVFVDPGFRGTSETFSGDIEDLRDFGLNDEISSIQIRSGEAWEVCRDIHFQNQCQVLTRSVSNLASLGWDDGISSIRLVRGQGRFSRQDPGIDGVRIFVDPNYRGTSETLFDDTSDLRDFGLNDQISSIEIPSGEVWEICQDINFQNRCEVVNRSVSNLGAVGWNDRISSMRRLEGSGLTPRGTSGRFDSDPRLILYARPGYRGAARVMQEQIRNIGAFGNRAASVEVRGGVWELCDQAAWRGNCVTVDQDVSDLSQLGLAGPVMSARPIYDRF
ncbi:MAG TPA: beta/gamma crystallin-related protein [Vicinamibacterales bacterium]|jgi:hypothetical protein